MARRFVYACVGVLGLAHVIVLPRPALAAWPSDPAINLARFTAAGDRTRPIIVSDGAGGAIIAWTDEAF